jgi:hypothetical protein
MRSRKCARRIQYRTELESIRVSAVAERARRATQITLLGAATNQESGHMGDVRRELESVLSALQSAVARNADAAEIGSISD